MKDYPTDKIRNLVLLGHGGTGKTSLTEAALFISGAITRLGRVDDGTTTSDFDPDEVKRKVSINASIAPVEWKDHKVNIIDAPGYADFIGDAYSGLAAADTAVIVVCAASGVQVGTELAWQMAERQPDRPRERELRGDAATSPGPAQPPLRAGPAAHR
jgi:elongation factor G